MNHRRQPIRPANLTAVVLSGGASRGAVQAGQLRAVLDAGVRPDLVVGCSAGAINAVAFAADPTLAGVDAIEATWRSLRVDDVFAGGNLSRLYHLALRHEFLHRGDTLRRTLTRVMPVRDLGDTRIPVEVATTDLASGETTWWSNGPVVPVLMASTALPGILPPVTLNGVRHVDGGVTDAVPITRAVAAGATEVFVLDVSASQAPSHTRGALGVLAQSYAAARRAHLDDRISRLAHSARIVVVPSPNLEGIGPFDFSAAATRIDDAYDTAVRFLHDLEPVTSSRSRCARRGSAGI